MELKKIMQKKSIRFLLQLAVFLVLMAALFGGYYFVKTKLDRRFEINGDRFSWVYQVDEIREEEGQLVIEGWAFKLGQDANEEFEIIIADADTEEAFFPKMEYKTREDVNQYFLCEYDYSRSGFTATIPLKKLELEDGVYEFLLRPMRGKEFSRSAMRMETYYAKHELLFANPKEFVAPEVAGTALSEVVENGVLRVYQPDFGTYVYQYDGELYWINKREFNFDEKGDWYVQFQMNTTQIEKLPKERLDNNWFWSNIGFVFIENEIEEIQTNLYRVTKCKVPTEYSITDVTTGNYIKGTGWIWQTFFYPRYVLK